MTTIFFISLLSFVRLLPTISNEFGAMSMIITRHFTWNKKNSDSFLTFAVSSFSFVFVSFLPPTKKDEPRCSVKRQSKLFIRKWWARRFCFIYGLKMIILFRLLSTTLWPENSLFWNLSKQSHLMRPTNLRLSLRQLSIVVVDRYCSSLIDND